MTGPLRWVYIPLQHKGPITPKSGRTIILRQPIQLLQPITTLFTQWAYNGDNFLLCPWHNDQTTDKRFHQFTLLPRKRFNQFTLLPYARFHQFALLLRERFNPVYGQGCGKAAIAAMRMFAAWAVSPAHKAKDANVRMSPSGLPAPLGFISVYIPLQHKGPITPKSGRDKKNSVLTVCRFDNILYLCPII